MWDVVGEVDEEGFVVFLGDEVDYVFGVDLGDVGEFYIFLMDVVVVVEGVFVVAVFDVVAVEAEVVIESCF